MTHLRQALSQRFGAENVHETRFESPDKPWLSAYSFLVIEVQARSPIKILMTQGLSDYRMPVLEKFAGKEHNELFFCLPSYWDLNDHSNPEMNWVFDALFRLQQHALDKQTWFGTGHTIPFANPLRPVSEKMKQMYFFLNDPVFMAEQLKPLPVVNKMVHFLGVTPIFEDEFDYKIGKGTYKFQKKLDHQDVTELLDHYRSTVLKSKWRFWG
ncbi:MAG: suppressor of fused domain protein [Bacteroidota bacterium]